MNNKMRILVFFAFVFGFFIACTKGENETQISKHGDDESHYNDRNCLECHYTIGSGEGWFSLGGSAQGNYQNHTVRVKNFAGDVVKEIEIDGLGNYFTTEFIDYSNGVFIDIVDANGVIQSEMARAIYNGGCATCHSQSCVDQLGEGPCYDLIEL